jgi:hypothetical protein
MNAQVQWLTPSPLWGQLSTAQDLTAYRRPAILRFATDTFMNDFQTMLKQSPKSLGDYVAQGENWQNPSAGLASTSSLPLKLFQPVQARFYLIASSLTCRMPGLPDHTVNRSQGESVAFVVRQLRPNAGFGVADTAVYDPTKCTEYAWTLPTTPGGQAGWTQVPQTTPPVPTTSLMPNEELLPLAPAQAGSNGTSRRILTGLIPASRRQQYVSAQTLSNGNTANGNGSAGNGNGTPQDPRADLFNRQVVTPWCLLVDWWNQSQTDRAAASATVQGYYTQSAEQSSALILADFASFLSQWIPDVWAAMEDSSKVGALNIAELALYNTLGAALRQAILNANQFDPEFESAAPGATFPPAGYTTYSLADPANAIDATTLLAPVTAALPPLSSVSQPPAPQPVPQKPSNATGNYYFIVRCVYVRPKCPSNVISPPSQPFQLASYFDSDAPARRIQVALPLDTSAASFRKYDKGVSFLMSDELRNQMSRVASLQDLSNGNIGSAGSVTLGWICSFSIPIITICAMILLFVIVIALNLVFFWLPFFRICLPVPGLKGKN